MFLQNMKKELSMTVSKQKVGNKKEMKQRFQQAEDGFLQQEKKRLSIHSREKLVTRYV